MRLHEIEKTEILDVLRQYFNVIINKVSINQQNEISVNGNIAPANNMSFPDNKLPVKFNKVAGDFYIDSTNLSSLEGCPTYVGGDFTCSYNILKSLIGGPEDVGGEYRCYKNVMRPALGGSLEGLPKRINENIALSYYDDLPLLKLLLIKDLKKIEFRGSITTDASYMTAEILNKYLGQGRGGILACAAELTKAGYKGNAKL